MYPGPLQLIRDVFILEYIYIVNTLWLNQHIFFAKNFNRNPNKEEWGN